MHHENEMEDEGEKPKAEQYELYDMYVGAVQSDDDAKDSMSEPRGCVAAEVNAIAREMLHLATRMGVRPQEYGARLRTIMGQFSAWSNGEGDKAQIGRAHV